MIGTIGEIALGLAVLAAAATFIAALLSASDRVAGLLKLARAGVLFITLMLLLASAMLTTALVQNQFSLSYVAGYTERALPIGYKLAAFWAGQEGSLLFWGLTVALMASVAVVQWRKRTGVDQAAAIATLAVVLGFFSALLLYAANPFTLSPRPMADGRGLNPMLQDPGMIAHPPLLFLGYAGFTIPFAVMMGALVAGRRDNLWLADIRRWVMVSFIFLTIGIVLGAEWAYVELGWGGYWAWDPVENASLLPWFTAAALLHSMMAQQRRGIFKRWNAALIALSFILCIFGSYLTRSGIVDSVHTFGESMVGTFFLVFLALSVVVSAAVIVWRRRVLEPEHEMETFLGREGAFLATNALMLIMMLTVLLGTIWPAISTLAVGRKVTVGPPFYNSVVVPMSLATLAMMAAGPLLFYGPDAPRRLARRIVAPGILALLSVGVAAQFGITASQALIAIAIGALAAGSILVDFITALWGRIHATGENPIVAALSMAATTHRRYGAQIAHVGMVMVMAGVAGSSLFVTDETIKLSPGKSGRAAGYAIKLISLDERREANFTATEAVVVLTDEKGVDRVLKPQVRFYDKHEEQPNREVAIAPNWKRDIYTILAGWEEGGRSVTVQILVNPLVSWIWIGTGVLVLGALVCMLPQLARATAPVAAKAGDAQNQTIAAAPEKVALPSS